MASIEEAIRTMLTSGGTLSAAGVPDARVTHSYRLQSTVFPAVTYEVTDTTLASSSGLNVSTVNVSAIAELTMDAVDLLPTIRDRLEDLDTYSTIAIVGVVVTNEATAPPSVGLGDEQEPATATIQALVYWS